MFSLKFKNLAWAGNEIRFIFAAFAVLALVLLREAAFPVIIIGHVLFSLINHLKFSRNM
jgi:CDP-diacylglycerol---serine O-phosphatidyltransferase